jgi:formamidopyrimidine-DNA glycosylase
MDQSVVAGIGNVYADEVLFHARIDPRVGVDALSEQQLRRVHRESQRVLERAIKARTEGKKLPRSWLLPLRRERDPECPRCGGRLSQGRVGGRETLWCPRHLDADSD